MDGIRPKRQGKKNNFLSRLSAATSRVIQKLSTRLTFRYLFTGILHNFFKKILFPPKDRMHSGLSVWGRGTLCYTDTNLSSSSTLVSTSVQCPNKTRSPNERLRVNESISLIHIFQQLQTVSFLKREKEAAGDGFKFFLKEKVENKNSKSIMFIGYRLINP